jgi:arginine decarboxylase
VNYLQFAESFNKKFPGFETDIHGLVAEGAPGEKRYFVDCLKIYSSPSGDYLVKMEY